MTKNKDPIDVVELLKKWRYFLILWAVLSAFFIWALDTTSGGIIAEMYALGGVYGWYIIDSILIGLLGGFEWAGVIWGAHDRYRRRPSAFLVNVLFYEVLVGVIFGVFLGMEILYSSPFFFGVIQFGLGLGLAYWKLEEKPEPKDIPKVLVSEFKRLPSWGVPVLVVVVLIFAGGAGYSGYQAASDGLYGELDQTDYSEEIESNLSDCMSLYGAAGYWDNCQGTMTANGNQYVGEFKDNSMHGQGTLTYSTGEQYVGEFKDGEQHGQGTYTDSSGSQYVGEHKDDMEHGQGTLTYSNGDKYVGEFKDNMRSGQGTYTTSKGEQYVGEWKDSLMHGKGTQTYANGDQYVGEFKHGLFHGQGTLTRSHNGAQITGEWQDGEFLG